MLFVEQLPDRWMRFDTKELTRMYNKNTILLVDDEEVVKQRLKDVITDDYEVLDASDAA